MAALLTFLDRLRSFREGVPPAQPALALLREVAAVAVAFFDDHRRDSLAEQILNVKGFSQLLVISHDDTFGRDTDHVGRVVEEDGISRVETS